MAKSKLFSKKNILILSSMIIVLSISVISLFFLTVSPQNTNETSNEKTIPSIIVSLDPMIISLVTEKEINSTKAIPQLKINIGIKTYSKKNADLIKTLKPKIRNKIIEHISKKGENTLNNINYDIKKKQIAILKEELKIITLTNFIPNEKNLEIFFSEYFLQS